MADIRRLVKLVDIPNGLSNPSGEADAVGWTTAQATGSLSSGPTQAVGARTGSAGTKHVEAAWTGVTSGTTVSLGPSSTATPVGPGMRVWGYGWGRVTAASTSLSANILWYDSTLALLSTVTLQTIASPTTSTWYEFQGAVTSPANAAFCKLFFVDTTTSATPGIWADDCAIVVDSAFAGPYFSGTATVSTLIKDLEVDQQYMAGRDSFSIKAPARNTSQAGTGRRYAGTFAIAESHANATAEWNLLVRGNTADLALKSLEALLASVEPLYSVGLHLEWRPDGATYSTYYEVRGPATWQSNYQRVRFTATNILDVNVSIPVAPLGRGAVITEAYGSQTSPLATPAIIQLPTTISGTAPSQVALTLNKLDTTGNPCFAMFAWWNRLPAPPSGYSNIFNFTQAETTSSTPSVWASVADATASGGNRLEATVTTAGTATSRYAFSTIGITDPTVDVEIWARVYLPSTIVSPRIIPSFYSGVGASIYTREWGTVGRPLTVPASGIYRLTRLGTVTLPVKNVGQNWTMRLDTTWAVSASSTIALDWVMLVPANQRAVSPTGEALDASYPRFLQNASNSGNVISKTLSPDLSAVVTLNGTTAADPGLGGALLEFPPGDVDMAILLSEMPADDGGSATTIATSYSCWLNANVIPRYFAVNNT